MKTVNESNLLTKALELGLKESEYNKILQLLGREPSATELAMYSVEWSEHCAYKHSRLQLKKLPNKSKYVLQGPGENAGVIDIGDGLAVAFKVESHNHPSAVVPFQGATTGVGGIVRDIFTMGARPIALLNSLRFGRIGKNPYANDNSDLNEDDYKRQRFLLEGVVSGIGHYGNTIGVPTIGGELYFEDSYAQNCLVNAMCIGTISAGTEIIAKASGIGNLVVLMGSKTGRDGIGGASILASAEFDESSVDKRPSVQVGDPFMEKILIEACLELNEKGLIVAMQDFGAAGLTCSTCEMSSSGGVGIEIDLDKVPHREDNMEPYELMMSESQERMMAVVEPNKLDEFLAVCEKWEAPAAVVGKITTGNSVVITSNSEVVCDAPADTFTEEAPIYNPKAEKPAYLDKLNSKIVDVVAPTDFNKALLGLVASENICSRKWVYQQYDHMVQTNTVLSYGADASVVRIKGTNKALAISIDCQSRYVYLDPFEGSKIAVAEAARNVAMSGARPMAVTDGLNFGNPEKPDVFWQFSQSIDGISEACTSLDLPIVSGNVSFYNENSSGGESQSIYPTPIIGVVGLIDDFNNFTTIAFKNEGDTIYLIGETFDELGASEYLRLIDGIYGKTPKLDLNKEKELHALVAAGIKKKLIKSAHDLSDGGLAISLVESCLAGKIGAKVNLDGDLVTKLFSESQSRAIITVDPKNEAEFEKLAIENKVYKLGHISGQKLLVNDIIDLELSSIKDIYENSLERMLGYEN